MRVKHAFTNPKADGADATIVRPSDWNADHLGDVENVAALVADTVHTYSNVAAGDYLRTREEGFGYEVAASGASDHHLTTAGGLKLYCLPNSTGWFNFAQMNPAADGVTDDYAKLALLLNAVDLPLGGAPTTGPCIFIPSGTYSIQSPIELKKATWLKGQTSGQYENKHAKLKFPTDTMGITVNRGDTINGGLESPSSGDAADCTIIEGLQIFSTVGTDATAHGIWLRARAVIRNCLVEGFSGNGINVVATAGGADSEQGNANCFRIEGCRSSGNGQNGFFTRGADANAGNIIGLDCTGNTNWGFWDSSFLGNTYIGCHTSNNGNVNAGLTPDGLAHTCYCEYDGDLYQAVPGSTEAELCSTTPGTDRDVWRFVVASDLFPYQDWTGAEDEGTFTPGGSYLADNINAKNVFIGCYSENSQGLFWDIGGRSLQFGGFISGSGIGAGAFIDANSGVVTGSAYTVEAEEDTGETIYTRLGAIVGDRSALSWASSEDANTWRFKHESGNWTTRFANNSDLITAFLTSTDTAEELGTGAPLPYVQAFPTIGIGRGNQARRHTYYSTTPDPTSDAYALGDIIWSNGPTRGGSVGWVCTTAGAVAGVAWAGNTVYRAGQCRTNDSGKTYICTVAGTSAASGGPTGTGSGITDGTVTWNYKTAYVFAPFGNSVLENTETYDPPSLAAGVVDTVQTITVTGAALGDMVDVSFSLDLQGITLRAWVSAADTVSYVFECAAGGTTRDLGSGTVKCRVRK
jgi:hypothetical protein